MAGGSGSVSLEAMWRGGWGWVLAGGVDVGLARAWNRDPQRVVDLAPAHLVVARQAGQDGEAGRVGGGPTPGAQVVRAQAPDRPGAGVPAGATALGMGVEELEQAAARAVHHDHVAVAVGVPTP